jgi:aspartyl-tRNA(Asn)/glutamyl-tRNA(Gln) amidotransferase subunit C
MALSDNEMRDLERLAKIDLEGEEREKLRLQLAGIIEFVKRLEKVDLSGAKKTRVDRIGGAGMGKDIPGPCLGRDEVLREAPESKDGFFVVPPVLEPEDD